LRCALVFLRDRKTSVSGILISYLATQSRSEHALAATKPSGSTLRVSLRLEKVVNTFSINEKFYQKQKALLEGI
jgi:hypothetical protein